MATLQEQMQTKLCSIDLPHESIKCFGRYVHVVCKGQETAEKWVSVIDRIYVDVKMVPHTWHAKENKGTNLQPSLISGWLIGGRISD